MYQKPNLLLLDEPTNHLDLDMREALTEALNDFSGALVLVAHDRALIRACCDTLLHVGGGRVVPYDGDLDDYSRAVQHHDNIEAQLKAPAAGVQSPRCTPRTRRATRARRALLRKEMQRIEKRMATIEQEKKSHRGRIGRSRGLRRRQCVAPGQIDRARRRASD